MMDHLNIAANGGGATAAAATSSGANLATLVATSPERLVSTLTPGSHDVTESAVTSQTMSAAVHHHHHLHHQQQQQQHQAAAVASSPMKLSDVLKRKRGGAKRGAVGARKSRTYAEETTPPSSAAAGCSMDGHDYLKSGGASGGGSSGGSAGSVGGARSKFGFPMAGHSGSGSSNNGTPGSGGSATKASNFLANLNPARWGRSHHHNQTSNSGSGGSPSGAACSSSPSLLPNVPKSLSNSQLAGNREKVKTWIREQANLFLSTYFNAAALDGSSGDSANGGGGQSGVEGSGGPASGLSVLSELTRLVQQLDTQPQIYSETLEQIRAIVADSDVSSFEILHSGLVRSLLKYLTADGPDRNDRLRLFLEVCLIDSIR